MTNPIIQRKPSTQQIITHLNEMLHKIDLVTNLLSHILIQIQRNYTFMLNSESSDRLDESARDGRNIDGLTRI